MENTDRSLVLQRLHELEDWAEYIVEALHLDHRLGRVVEMQALKQMREMSWSLRDTLHIIATQVEHSHDLPQEHQEQDRVEAGPAARAVPAPAKDLGSRRSA